MATNDFSRWEKNVLMGSGLPDFSWGTTYQNVKKYRMTKHTKWQLNIPTGCKIDQHLPLQGPPKFTQI
jgi:hypothetical protein